MAGIKGRVTKKEVAQIKYLFRSGGEPFEDLTRASAELSTRLAQILGDWNTAHASDLDVLRRHNCTARAKGANIVLGAERVGIELPAESEIETIGRDGFFGPDPYPDFYIGGDHRGRRKDLPGMKELAEMALTLRAEHKRRLDEFNAWVDAKPFRRDVAQKHPRIARLMGWESDHA